MTIVTNSIRWSHHQKLVSRHSWLLPLPQCNRTFPTFKKSAPPVCWQTQMSWKQLGWKRCLQTALTNLFFKHRFLGNRCLETIVLKIFWSPNFSSDLVTNLVFTQFGGQFITKYTANISVTIYKLFGIFGSVEFPPCSTPLENAPSCRYLPQTLGGRTTFAILQGNSWQGNTRLSTFFKTATSFRLVDPSIRSCSHQKAKILRSSQKGLWRPCLKVVEFSEPLKGFVMGHWSPVEPTRANQTPCVKSRVLKSRLGGECSAKRTNAA